MRISGLLLGGAFLAVALMSSGCDTLGVANNEAPGPYKTQIVTYPVKADMHVDGKFIGRSPITVTLPQDANGFVNGEMTIQAIPTHEGFKPQVIVFNTSNRVDRIPERFMIDLTLNQTNHASLAAAMSSERSFITSRVPWRQPARTARGEPQFKRIQSPRAATNETP